MGRNDDGRRGSRSEGRRLEMALRHDEDPEITEEDVVSVEFCVSETAAIGLIECDSYYGLSWGFKTGEGYAVFFNGYELAKKIN